MYEHCFRNLDYRTRSRLKESRIPLVGFSREVNYPLGVIDLKVTIGEYGINQTVIMKFTVFKSRSPYNALLETLRKCRQIKESQALSHHARVIDPSPMQTSSEVTNLRASLALVETHSRRPGKEPMQLDDVEERRQLDKGRKLPNSSAITEHRLDTYPHIEPKVQKKKSLALDRRKVVTDEVNEWLKAGIMRMEEGKFLGYVVTSEEAAKVAFLKMKKLVSELLTLTTLKKGETIMMYSAAADEVVSAVFLKKRDGRQIPIHYVSRSLQG
nr:hypothetical protein [Tanacetum cinerariifolium]